MATDNRSRPSPVLLFAALIVPLVAVGLVLDLTDRSLGPWVWAVLVVVYFVAVGALVRYLTRPTERDDRP